MAKLITKPKKQSSSILRNVHYSRRIGLIATLSILIAGAVLSLVYRPGKGDDGFWLAVAARSIMGDVSALGDAAAELSADPSSDAAPEAEISKRPQRSTGAKIVRYVSDSIGLSKYNISTGAHPLTQYEDMIYVGDVADFHLLSQRNAILGRDYDSKACDATGDVLEGDIVCGLPVTNLEWDDYLRHCRRIHGPEARLPYSWDYAVVKAAKLFRPPQNLAVWLMDAEAEQPDADCSFCGDNYLIDPGVAAASADPVFPDNGDNDKRLTSVCVLPVAIAGGN